MSISKENKELFKTTISPVLKKALKVKAAELGCNGNDLIEVLISRYIIELTKDQIDSYKEYRESIIEYKFKNNFSTCEITENGVCERKDESEIINLFPIEL